jgi:hypothetical protein
MSNSLISLINLKAINSHPEINFVLITESSVTSDDGYGGRDYSIVLTLRGAENEDQLTDWIKENLSKKFSQPDEYTILKISRVKVNTQISIALD